MDAPHRRNRSWTPVVIVCLGIAIALFGYLRSCRSLVRTTGLVAGSIPVGGMKSSIWRVVDYTYTVADHAYAGRSIVRNSWGHATPVQMGREIPVFFVSADPDVSYAFDPPTALPWVTVGSTLVLVGGVIILFSWST